MLMVMVFSFGTMAVLKHGCFCCCSLKAGLICVATYSLINSLLGVGTVIYQVYTSYKQVILK